MDNLNKLIDLLSSRQLEEDDINAIANSVRASIEDDELNWLDKDMGEPVDVARRQVIELGTQLSDWFAVGDKNDEIHEQMLEWFDPELPPFPHDEYFDSPAYVNWLNSVLATSYEQPYELLDMDNGYGDDNLAYAAVLQADMPHILELCQLFGFRAQRASKMLG